MDIVTRRLIKLSWVSLHHQVECGCHYGTAPEALCAGLKGDMAAVLDDRQRQVLILRWGLEDGLPQTLTAVGRELGVTRERIRQIEAKALRLLREPTEARNKILPRGKTCLGRLCRRHSVV